MTSPYQTPTKRLAAAVFIDDGSRLVGDLHLHPNAPAPGGYESVLGMINNDDSFFPFCEETGVVALVGKQRLVSLSYATEDVVRPEPDAGSAPVQVELLLSDGRKLIGTAFREVPKAHPRTLEFLNGPGAFVPIVAENRTHLVNRAHIRLVHPLD